MTRIRRALAQLRALLFGPPAPAPSARVFPPIDYTVLHAGGGIWTERTRGTTPEASGARSFALGYVFGGITVFAVIVWATIGKAGVGL